VEGGLVTYIICFPIQSFCYNFSQSS